MNINNINNNIFCQSYKITLTNWNVFWWDWWITNIPSLFDRITCVSLSQCTMHQQSIWPPYPKNLTILWQQWQFKIYKCIIFTWHISNWSDFWLRCVVYKKYTIGGCQDSYPSAIWCCEEFGINNFGILCCLEVKRIDAYKEIYVLIFL